MALDKELLRQNLPLELQNCTRWVMWRLEDSVTREGKERERCKILKQSKKPLRNASSTDPESWSALEDSLTLPLPEPCEKYKDDPHTVGLGLVFGSPFFGVDLDKCYDAETGEIDPWACELLSQLPPTYCELSPSRRGFHLWYRCPDWAKLPAGHRTEKAEVYSRGRYFTMTGERASNSLDKVTDLPLAEALKIFALVKATSEKKKVVSGSPKLEQLMTSVDFPDLSAAVHSLLIQLCYRYPGDAEYIEKKFKESKLYLETHWKGKWERRRAEELEKAMVVVQANPRRGVVDDSAPRELLVIRGDEAKPENVVWLWQKYLARRILIGFYGLSGQAKSPVTIDLLARVTRGKEWPDGQPNIEGPRSVILLNAEDDLTTKILPRFLLAGGDPQKLYYVKGSRPKDSTVTTDLLALDRDLPALRELVTRLGDVAMIVIDPVTNNLGRVKMNAEQEVRAVLMPLAELAVEHDLCVVLVGHFNRREKGTVAQHRTMGAAFYGVCRNVYLFSPDPDSGDKYSHMMCEDRDKSAPSWKYHTEMVELEHEGQKISAIRVGWDNQTEASGEDSENAVDQPSQQEKNQNGELGEALRRILEEGGGELAVPRCQELLGQAFPEIKGKEINWARVCRRAKVKASQKPGAKNQWVWSLKVQESLL